MEPNAAARLAKAFFTWFSPFCFNCWSVSSCFHSFWQSLVRFMYNSFATASSTYKHLGLFNELVKSWLCHMRRFIFQRPLCRNDCGQHANQALIALAQPQFKKTVFINANYIQLKFCTLAHNQGTNMLLYTQDAYRCTRLHRGMYVFVCTDACTCICIHDMHTYMRVYARICTHMHKNMHAYANMHTCAHMNTCMRA